jgi:hypothetical protein
MRLVFDVGPHGDSHLLRSHIGGASVEIATEFRNAILRKTTFGAKADTERRGSAGRLCSTLWSRADSRTPHSLRYEYTTAKGPTYALV